MKSILKFNLPEEKEEYMCAVNGHKYKYILLDLESKLRSWNRGKAEHNFEDADDKIRELVYDLLHEYHVSLEEE